MIGTPMIRTDGQMDDLP